MKLRFRYSLKLFLLLWLLIGLGLGWFGIHWQRARRQAAVVKAMAIGSPSYDYERAFYDPPETQSDPDDLEFYDWNHQQPKNSQSFGMMSGSGMAAGPMPAEPQWLINSLGVDFFHPVTSYMYPQMRCGLEIAQPKLTVGLGKEMDQLGSLPQLRHVYLWPDEIDVPQVMESSLFTHLGNLRELEILWLGGMPLKAEHLAPLRDHPKLKKLTLIDEKITAEALAALGTLPALEELVFGDCQGLADSDLAFLRTWKNLRLVDLMETPVDDRIVASLKELPKLEALNLSQTNITATTMLELQKLPSLRRVNLSDLPVTDAVLAETVKGWSRLETLDLSGTEAGELFAAECENLPGLKYLNLWHTPYANDNPFPEEASVQRTGRKVDMGLSGGFMGGGSGGFGGGMGTLDTDDEDSEDADEPLDSNASTGDGFF